MAAHSTKIESAALPLRSGSPSNLLVCHPDKRARRKPKRAPGAINAERYVWNVCKKKSLRVDPSTPLAKDAGSARDDKDFLSFLSITCLPRRAPVPHVLPLANWLPAAKNRARRRARSRTAP